MKIIFFYLAIFLLPSQLFSLDAEIQRYDTTTATPFSAITSSKSLVYLAGCSRAKLKQFEWKVWKENWSVRARLQPIATIIVHWEREDPFLSDAELFIQKAQASSLSIGGHILCLVQLERDRQTLMVKSVSFRSYRQLFISGNQSWEGYLNDLVSKEQPLTVEDFKSIGKSK